MCQKYCVGQKELSWSTIKESKLVLAAQRLLGASKRCEQMPR